MKHIYIYILTPPMIYPNDPQCKCIHMHTQYQNHQPAPDASQRVRGCEVRRLSGMLTITIGCKPSGNRGLLSQPIGMQVDNVKTTSPQQMQANAPKGGKGIARNYVVLCNCVAGNWDGHI